MLQGNSLNFNWGKGNSTVAGGDESHLNKIDMTIDQHRNSYFILVFYWTFRLTQQPWDFLDQKQQNL